MVTNMACPLISAKALEKTNYLFEEYRMETFKTWVFDEKKPCSATRMAQAGFIFIGNKHEPDLVECFYCNKTLDGWEPDDDPFSEHFKHAPYCDFGKLQRRTNQLLVSEFINLKFKLIEKIVKKQFEDAISALNAEVDNQLELIEDLTG